MALVTVHRSPTPSNYTTETLSCDLADVSCDVDSSVPSPLRLQSCSECYLAVKGAALILPQSECMRAVSHDSKRGDIGCHLQSMFYLLRSQDTIKVAVRLENRSSSLGHHRYMALVSTTGTQDLEESVVLGIDVLDQKATVGLVLPIWSDLCIRLDGDGGYSLTSNDSQHIFKPVSVQAMWSSLQCLNKVRDVASQNSYLPEGLTHTWIQYYQSQISSSQNFIAEWHAMDDIESHREDPESSATGNLELEKIIKTKLREMALTVDFEEVTSKQLRMTLEEEMNQSLTEFRHFIDEEIVVIFRQMEAPSKIFDYLYLGTEWNASNLDELRTNGVGYILNVAREIDNFFPGSFKYLNIRVHDTDDADLLKHWDKTYKFISEAKNNQSKVLVHCKMGVSRSASTVVAFAMKEMNWTHEEALKFVQKQRSCVKPNKGFKKQLETYQGILDASKHRHNKLWKSSLSEHQTSTPVREAEFTSSDVASDQSVANDTLSILRLTQQSLDNAQTIAYSDESAVKRDCRAVLNTDRPSINSDDSTERATHSPELWNDWNSSCPSESQDDLDGLYPDAFLDSLDKAVSQGQDSAAGNITLLRYEKVDRDLNFSEAARPASDGDDSDSEDTSSDGDNVHVCGYYDLSMLAGYRVNSQCEEDDDDDEAFLSVEASPLLHPDMVLECIQAENRKKRQTLQLLRQKQLSSVDSSCGKSVLDSAEKRVSRSSCASENSEGVGLSVITKVRPDNYWIRETSEEGVPSADDTLSAVDESASAAVVQTEATVNNVLPAREAEPSVSPVTCSSIPVVLPVDASLRLDSEESRRVSESENVLKCEVSIPEKGCAMESVGLSHKGTEDVSETSPKSEFCDEPLAESECLAFGDVFRGEFSGSAEVHRLTKNSSDASLQRPRSIYETEDILLEPGIVLKTKREIELREKSSSSIELSFGKESKSVQRSSSWRLDRSRSRDRNSERRRTCLPVFLPSPASTDRHEKPTILHETNSSECDLRRGTDDCSHVVGENLSICRISLDDVEVEKGIVKKTTKGFEEGLRVPVVSAAVEFGSDESFSHVAVSVNSEFPVEVGLVRRQTKNIETRLVGTSPQLIGTFTDLEAKEQEESSGCERVVTSSVQGETVTPLSSISTVPPSGDFLSSSSKTTARRDERRLQLSLSQDPNSVAAQSFGSPNRTRKELFSAPLDLTQKELSTRKACSPMRENSRGFELHSADTKKVPCMNENIFPQQSNVISKADRLHDQAEKDFGSFSRTFSLRETSSLKFDEREKSKFSRTRSLRGFRPHHATTNPTISSQLVGKQQLLTSVADDHRLARSSQQIDSPLHCSTTFCTGVEALAQSSIDGKQKGTDRKGTAYFPDKTAIDSNSDKDFRTKTVWSGTSSGIMSENVLKTEFLGALESSVSPQLPNKGVRSEPLPSGTFSTINCGALESSNAAELQNNLCADISSKAQSSDPAHCLSFSKNSCTSVVVCSTSAAVSVDSLRSRCSDNVLSSVADTACDISSAAFPVKGHPGVVKFQSVELELNTSIKAECECLEKEDTNTGTTVKKSFLKMQVRDQMEKNNAKIIQIQSTMKAEEVSKSETGEPIKIPESNMDILLPRRNKVFSAASDSLQKAASFPSFDSASASASGSMHLISTQSNPSDARKMSQSKISQLALNPTETILNPQSKPGSISSTLPGKSATAGSCATTSNRITMPSTMSALGSNSNFAGSVLMTDDTSVSALSNKRPDEDVIQLDVSNTVRLQTSTEQQASKHDGKCIESDKLSNTQIKDASRHDKSYSKHCSDASPNAEPLKTAAFVPAFSDKHGSPKVGAVQSIARKDLECCEKKTERLPDSQRIISAPQPAAVDQFVLPSVDSVRDQQGFVKHSGESFKGESEKCQKEFTKTSQLCSSNDTKCKSEIAPVKVSGVVMRQNKPLKSQASSDTHSCWSEPLVSGPTRSTSLHEHSTRKLYGKSHPLTRLPADKTHWSLPLADSSMSRRGRVDTGLSSPVIDITSGLDKLLN